MILLSNWITGLWSGLELSLFDWLVSIPWRKPIYTKVPDFALYRFNLVNWLTDCESCQKLVQQFLPSVNSLFMQVMVAVLP